MTILYHSGAQKQHAFGNIIAAGPCTGAATMCVQWSCPVGRLLHCCVRALAGGTVISDMITYLSPSTAWSGVQELNLFMVFIRHPPSDRSDHSR
jgi:hypothetical protein